MVQSISTDWFISLVVFLRPSSRFADVSLFIDGTCRSVTMANACGHDNNVKHYAWQELTSEEKRYVETHLNETDEIRENAIREMKRWVEESDDLCAGIGKSDNNPFVTITSKYR